MKSHVTLEQQVCMVCGIAEDTGQLLLDSKMRPLFEMRTPTKLGLCKEHRQKYLEGYIALVVIDPSKSKANVVPGSEDVKLRPHDAWRTGDIALVKKIVWNRLFTTPAPDGPVAYVDEATFKLLKEKMDGR